ncbi:hypothetical protein HYV69_01180 [Candidatus Uhrbacteria bacterium]|nr:hypothetical protein [Candidatus Uhrbacteria bacterium]
MGIRRVRVTDLKMNLFVRKELNTEHALYLGQLIESGVKMKDMIDVTDRGGEQNVVVEGRHRKEGYELAHVEDIDVRVLEFESEAEMIGYAYRANTGGSLPPTPQDTEHTVMLLIDKGETIKHIGELLGLPASMARIYVKSVKSKIARQNLMKATAAVTEGGLTVQQAAEKHGADFEDLKTHLSGKRKQRKNGVADIQRSLTSAYKSMGSSNAAMIRSLLEKLEDGDVTRKQVTEIFNHLTALQKSALRSIEGWRKRFEAKKA